MKFYTYLWLREDSTPYYVGKGQGHRAFIKHRVGSPPPKDRIILQYWIDEATAFAYEVYQIDFWGRKDLDTGVLRNCSDGGEKPPNHKGLKRSAEHCAKISASNMGREGKVNSGSFKKGHNLGGAISEERKQAISRHQKGRNRTEEEKIKISKSLTGRTLSESHRASLKGHTPWNKGVPQTEETKNKISNTLKSKSAVA